MRGDREFAERPFALLMVDDDDEDVYTMRRACESCGLPVKFESVADSEALDRRLEARQRPAQTDEAGEPDLLFLDINLPRVSGFEILAGLRKEPDRNWLPVVMLTTSDSANDARRGYESGANAVITKPATYAQSVAILRASIGFWSAPGVFRLR